MCRVFAFQRQADDARFLTALTGCQIFLVLQDGAHPTLLGDGELGTGIGVEGGDLHLEAILL
ncbi:hypothetical protein D3C71_2150620 [compost metagenome]